MLRRILTAALLLGLASTPRALAQQVDRWEVAADAPIFRGVQADVPIPPEDHFKNEGSAVDDLGLCVGTSLMIAGKYQGVPGMELGKDSAWWKYIKSRPGGSYPEKLAEDVRRMFPDEKWISWEGDVTDLITAYTSRGIPVSATMNTGELYSWQGIHHYIVVGHLRDGLAMVVDNNDPRKYHWMAEADYQRRFIDGRQGWLFIWLRKSRSDSSATIVTISIAAAVACACEVSRRQQLQPVVS